MISSPFTVAYDSVDGLFVLSLRATRTAYIQRNLIRLSCFFFLLFGNPVGRFYLTGTFLS